MKTFLFTVFGPLFILSIYAQNDTVKDSLSIQKLNKPEIKIRCQASIRNAKSPLFIIDGVPSVSGDKTFESLNPEDIMSIQVLKNPPAIFCYGLANNGVVLISTKASQKPIIVEKESPFKVYKICNNNWNTHQDIYQTIQARVPGISITSNNNLNATPIIKMRGDHNTIIIVDGIRYDASILSTLNPFDIESVKVSNSPAAQNYFINQ